MQARTKISLSFFIIFILSLFSLSASDHDRISDDNHQNGEHFHSRPTVVHADLIIFHEKGSHTNVHIPPAWRRELSVPENVIRITQEGISQGYKQTISTLVSQALIHGFYKLWSFITGPSFEEQAQLQSVNQKEVGNLMVLLDNNQKQLKMCSTMKCSTGECEQGRAGLRQSLEKQQQDLLSALANKTKS